MACLAMRPFSGIGASFTFLHHWIACEGTLTPEAEVLAEQYSEAVTGRFPKGARVKVLVRNQKGKAVLDFKGIPLEQVNQLVEALSGQLHQVREVRPVEKPTVG
jgi:hypothetical protein